MKFKKKGTTRLFSPKNPYNNKFNTSFLKETNIRSASRYNREISSPVKLRNFKTLKLDDEARVVPMDNDQLSSSNDEENEVSKLFRMSKSKQSRDGTKKNHGNVTCDNIINQKLFCEEPPENIFLKKEEVKEVIF